jgi:hypothetical protein
LGYATQPDNAIWIPFKIPVTVTPSQHLTYSHLSIMTSDGKAPSSQSGFFSNSGELGGAQPQFTEICTALYERELLLIAHKGPANVSILRRRLAGLPHHIRSVARYLIDNNSPLDIDPHNGSWFIKQPGKCPGISQAIDKKYQWYREYADYGLVVPICITTLEGMHIELDSIDSVNHTTNTLHTNKHGWFSLDGEVAHSEIEPSQYNTEEDAPCITDANAVLKRQLLKPTTAIMASACSGHMWRHKSKGAPRALSLREMRLSTHINWKNFTLKG